MLAQLEKGHTRRDFERVVELLPRRRPDARADVRAFTPWTTLAGYCELLAALDRLDLVEHVAPMQLMIRLLIPEGSRLSGARTEIRSIVAALRHRIAELPWEACAIRACDACRLKRHRGGASVTRLTASAARDIRPGVGGLAHDAAGVERYPSPRGRAGARRRPLSQQALVMLSGAHAQSRYCSL